MNDSCPIQTPVERQRNAIVSKAQDALLEKILAALTEADETAVAALRASGEENVPSLHGLLTANMHQKLYCLLCGADPQTFAGGNAKTAISIIRNSQQIAKHYWGADIEPYPRP